jgi:Flp pilus assembly protein TadD
MTGAAMESYKEGMSLYGQAKHAEAIEAFGRALELQPDWSDCLQAQGMAQMNSGQLKEALVTLTRVTELAAEDPLAFTSLSMCWMRLENIEEAEKAQAKARMLSWKQELKANPDAPRPDNDGMHVTQ